MKIKGYPIDSGYMGYLEEDHDYHLFETEGDYKEYVQEYVEES